MSDKSKTEKSELSRRDFIRSAAVTGAGVLLAQNATGQDTGTKKVDDLNVGIIGTGSQGRVLIAACLKIPGIRYKAVCDIWKYSQKYASNILKKFGQPVNVYQDYQDMLAKEKDLDAILIATPDWVHAEHTIACLKAGKHVYCEKEMSNDLGKAKQMVLTARETGKLLQIGHQRRSNPRYWHAKRLIEKDKILGRVTQAYGQWNRSVAQSQELGWPKKYTMDEATLKKYGYDSMKQFRNWRWFKKYSGGAIADLGSHQIDIFNWFLATEPKTVLASGGLDYYKNREWYDTIMAIYQYAPPAGTVRAFYQVLNTTSYGGYYEAFMGDEGSLVISEDTSVGYFFREVQAKRREWEDDADKVSKMGKNAITLKIGETRKKSGKKDEKALQMEEDAKKPIHQPHLENFFAAVRDPKNVKLNCPGEIGYETAVTVLRVNTAVAEQKALDFKPDDFKV
ncbi:MAG: Gfo/Idh/MocA family oxidoreductase [Planctomycetes bacterium]|nr:Gfo/Idh/MocA family oxidoreductase [Planctomycetota bacterium]